jgi:hypothetical protein
MNPAREEKTTLIASLAFVISLKSLKTDLTVRVCAAAFKYFFLVWAPALIVHAAERANIAKELWNWEIKDLDFFGRLVKVLVPRRCKYFSLLFANTEGLKHLYIANMIFSKSNIFYGIVNLVFTKEDMFHSKQIVFLLSLEIL